MSAVVVAFPRPKALEIIPDHAPPIAAATVFSCSLLVAEMHDKIQFEGRAPTLADFAELEKQIRAMADRAGIDILRAIVDQAIEGSWS